MTQDVATKFIARLQQENQMLKRFVCYLGMTTEYKHFVANTQSGHPTWTAAPARARFGASGSAEHDGAVAVSAIGKAAQCPCPLKGCAGKNIAALCPPQTSS